MHQTHEGFPSSAGSNPDAGDSGGAAPSRPLSYYEERLRAISSGDLNFSPEDFIMTHRALEKAFIQHAGVKRASGEPFVDHSWKTLSNLWKVGIRNSDVLSAALLHDVYEDSPGLRFDPQNPEGEKYIPWYKKTWEKIAEEFNPQVADLVMTMTRPVPDGSWPLNDKDADRIYADGLMRGPVGAVLIKMADRLHNLRTLSGFDKKYGVADGERRKRKAILGTRDTYLNIFRRDFSRPEFDDLSPRDRRAFEMARGLLYDQIVTELRKYSYFFEIPPES